MELFKIRIIITTLATFIAIIFIWLSFVFPAYSILILNIEVILLPTIYIVGNYLAENILEERYKQLISFISSEVDELQEKYNKEKNYSLRLEKELEYLSENEKD